MQERWRALRRQVGEMRGYLVALGVSNAVGVLRLLLNPILHAENPYLLSVFAVLIATGLGGLGPGLLATAIGALWGASIVPPNHGHGILPSIDAIRFGFFILVSVAITLLAESWRRDRLSLAHALRLRDDFLRIAAHELNTPLTTVLGSAEILQARLERSGDLTPQNGRLLSSIIRQARRQRELVRLLLDFSRLEQGQLPLEPAPFNFGELVRQVVEESQSTTSDRLIVFHGVERAVPISGDAPRLEQVVQNLLQNAIKYSPQDSAIEVHLALEQDEGVLRITDHGIGIPAAEQAHIFDRFYRARNVASGFHQGFGIGLYIVREIVTRHGGSISVQSIEGQGSTFTIRLPLQTSPV
jgi:signal transduction histidine kinase